jgi:hypothetical protein
MALAQAQSAIWARSAYNKANPSHAAKAELSQRMTTNWLNVVILSKIVAEREQKPPNTYLAGITE